jgi:aspartate aminotransferase-like enzyme
MTQRIAAEGGYASAAVGDLATDEGAVLVVEHGAYGDRMGRHSGDTPLGLKPSGFSFQRRR